MLCLIFYIFLLSGSSVLSQFVGSGPCPKLDSMKYLNRKKISGIWYTVECYPSAYDLGAKCSNINFINSNNELKIKITGINSIIGVMYSLEGHIDNTDSDGILHINLPEYANEKNINVTVLYTDYNGILMLYMCEQILDNRINLTYLWILSRTKSISALSMLNIRRIMMENHLATSALFDVDQQHCPNSFYYIR